VILKVAGRLDADDPTGFHGALESEKSLSESLVDEFFGMASPGDPEMDLNSPGDSETDAQQVEDLRLFFEQIEMEVDIEGWQDEAPNQIRANVDRYWRDVFRTWSNRRSQSFVQECQALDEKVANDEYGPYMSLMGAALGNALQQTAQQNQIFESDIDLLKSIESGTRTENQTINAAFLYMQIVNEIQNDPEWRSNPATIAEITRLLQEAVHCEVSRFPNPEDLSITLQQPVLLWTAPTIPWWLPEIDRVLGWLIETGDDDGLKKMDGDSIARLETAVLVITDLCEDLNISSSVVADSDL